MIFPALAFVVVLTSAILWLFGFTPADGSIFGILFSSGSAGGIFKSVLTALWNSVDLFADLFGALTTIIAVSSVAAGVYFNRDEPIYGGLGVLVFKMFGLYSVVTYAGIPERLEPVVLLVVGLFNTIFVISFINWIRGKGE